MTASKVAAALGINANPSDAPGHWPRDTTLEMESFYGLPGTGLVRIIPPYALFYAGKKVDGITVHKKIADPVMRVLAKVLAHYGPERIEELRLNIYDGCYNNRPKRGGTSLSTHAYAAAIDWCAESNALRQDHNTALFARPDYVAWWQAWEAEGAVSLGRARDFDWMHVQFARL
jgi:hypothetical protein